jgi:hypothetical protein
MGCGYISVGKSLFEKQEPDSNSDKLITEPLVKPTTTQGWHDFLMLPEEYEVIGVASWHEYDYRVTVKSEAISELTDGSLPNITLCFCIERDEDDTRHTCLNSIEIDKPERRVIWQRQQKSQSRSMESH